MSVGDQGTKPCMSEREVLPGECIHINLALKSRRPHHNPVQRGRQIDDRKLKLMFSDVQPGLLPLPLKLGMGDLFEEGTNLPIDNAALCRLRQTAVEAAIGDNVVKDTLRQRRAALRRINFCQIPRMCLAQNPFQRCK